MSARRQGSGQAGPPGRLRIIAGSRRGRYIKVPRGNVRPTSEMVREAIFNVLGPIGGLVVLDLFAGSGALGLEALSRGAASCTFVEGDPAVAAVLRENIRALDYERAGNLLVAPYEQAVQSLIKSEKQFDLLFMDPPYKILSEVEASLTALIGSVLTEAGVVVIESDKTSQVTFGLIPVFARTYGDTKITMVKTGQRRSLV